MGLFTGLRVPFILFVFLGGVYNFEVSLKTMFFGRTVSLKIVILGEQFLSKFGVCFG